MRYITALILLFMLQVSSADLFDSHPINPDVDSVNHGSSSRILEQSIGFGVGASSISSSGRFIAYVTEHENLENSLTIDYIVHRYDRSSNTTLSSNRILKNSDPQSSNKSAFLKMSFEDSSAQSIIFTYLAEGSYSAYRYHFDTNDVSVFKADTGPLWAISPSGQFFIYGSNGNSYVFDKNNNVELIVPATHSMANGNIIDFEKPGLLTRYAINDQGSLILATDSDSRSLEGASQYYQYNIKTEEFISFNSLIPLGFDIGIDVDIFSSKLNLPLISNNDQYISLPARNSTGSLVILLVDTISLKVLEHMTPFDLSENGSLVARLLTNTGVAQYFRVDEKLDNTDEAEVELYLYDFRSNQLLERTILPVGSDFTEYRGTWIDQITLEGDIVVRYDTIIKIVSGQENIETSLLWEYLSANKENEISIAPENIIIDPYLNKESQFSVEVSGTDIYGLDVSCNLSSTSLSVTQVSYDSLFNLQNTITLPLIYDAISLTGTEILVAPELAFDGAGSFIIAGVIADFTTENIEVTCIAEMSDENGQLLQVTLTPATIRIDDGVHGGSGTVSGIIEIANMTDLSGVEVVLTIDGRQVKVLTGEDGRFEFDGLRDGNFTISLTSENYVQSCQVASVTEGDAIDLGTIELLAGDINVDGNIDIADFTFMAARYRSNQGEADYNDKADLNKDRTINIQDLAILGSHFGSVQCDF